jgi:di/tricarboxylate transporter
MRATAIPVAQKEGLDLFHLKGDDILVEAVVSTHSPLVGQSVCDSNFRSEFDAAIIAIHRHGTRLTEKIGGTVLKGGDTLLIVAKQRFLEPHRFHNHFALISKVSGHSYVRRSRAWLAIFLITTLIVCGAATDVDFLELCFYCFAALLLTKCITVPEALASIDISIIINIAAGFGISTGMVKSGAAQMVADVLMDAAEPSGLIGVYIMLYLATVLFNAVVTNNAAASIMFPIAYQIGKDLGGDIRPILYILMMGASADFMTPTGYQCNLMVYGPGGYAFTDYFKFGWALQLIMGFVTVGVVMDIDSWWIWTLALLGIMLIVLFFTRKPLDPKKYKMRHRESAAPLTASDEKGTFVWHPDLGVDEGNPIFALDAAEEARDANSSIV